MPTGEEQEAYLRDMLDPSNRDHADLLVEFTEKREEFSGEEQGLRDVWKFFTLSLKSISSWFARP